jgi:hypothetical protein
VARSVALFLVWGGVGFIAGFALLYGFTPLGPLFVLLGWAASRYLPRISGSRLPEAFGTVGGFGAFWLFVASTVDDGATAFALAGALAVVGSIACYLVVGRNRCVSGVAAG